MTAPAFYPNKHRSRFVFKEETGALLVFDDHSVQLFKSGANPMAMQKTRAAPTWHFSLGIDCFDFVAFERRIATAARFARKRAAAGVEPRADYGALALSRFIDSIPVEIQNELRHYRACSWPMYSFLARCGEPALELSQTNRGLAFCIANARLFAPKKVRWEMRRARRLLRARRKDAAAELGFPASDLAVRVLGKLSRDVVNRWQLDELRRLLHDPAIAKRMGHLRVVNRGVLRLLSKSVARRAVTDRLLAELAEQGWGGARVAYAVLDAIDVTPPERRGRLRLRSLEETYAYVGDQRANEVRHRLARPERALPAAPLAGIPGMIEPLTTDIALLREGIDLHHCLKDEHYADAAFSGGLAVYKVLEPQRCTLSIQGTPDGNWEMRELSSYCNNAVSDYTASVLRSWLLMANTAAREAKAAGGAPRDLLALSPRDLQPLDPWAYALALPRSQMDLCFESVEMSDEDFPF